MSHQLRVRLTANHYRLTFPHAIASLRELLPDLQTAEPDWLTIAQALEAAEPAGTRPAGFAWTPEAALRPDDGPVQQHLATARSFATEFPGWLLQIPLPGNPVGLGRYQKGVLLLPTPEFIRLLPHLFTEHPPEIWARTWPDLQEAAIDVDRLDACCDGATGYFVELFRGGHDREPRAPEQIRTCAEDLNRKID